MIYALLPLVPPLLVVLCAVMFRRVILSFVLGIIASALIVTQGHLVESFWLISKRFLASSGLNKIATAQELLGNWNLFIFLFLMVLGIIIRLLQVSGASGVFAQVVRPFAKNKCSVEKASLFLSFLFFIDDYFSVLTVGSVMRPLAQRYHLHPVKLAFLVTAMATPITILAPLSSWVGEIVLQLKLVGIASDGALVADPYFVFLKSIPFIFYAIFLIIGTWYIVVRGISYGPMMRYDAAQPKEEKSSAEIMDAGATLTDFLLPIAILIGGVLVGFLYTGGYNLFGGPHTFVQAIKNTIPHQALLGGGLASLGMSCIYFLARKKITGTDLKRVFKEGALLMLPSIIMLVCAWTFGSLLRQDLHTGDMIASLFVKIMNVQLLPMVCFLFSALISCMIGSAWATIGIMLPIVVPLLQTVLGLPLGVSADFVLLLFPIIGATLSGAIMGTNISFISDNPIMTCASTGANHYEHIKTMTWYVIPIAIATAVAYAVVGMSAPGMSALHVFGIGITVGVIMMIVLLELFQRLFGK